MSQNPRYELSERLSTPWISLLLGFGFLFVCMMVAASTSGWLTELLYGSRVSLTDLAADPAGHWVFRVVQGFSGLAVWGLSAVFWAIYTGGFTRQLGFNNRPWPGFLGLAALATVCALPFIEWTLLDEHSFSLPESMRGFEAWVIETEAKTETTLIQVFSNLSTGAVLGNILVVAVIPAFAEELFFRGFLMGTLRRIMNPHLAVWLSALVFSLIHMQFYGFFSRMLLGALFAYFYLWSGNLWSSIIAHFVHNFSSIAIALILLRSNMSLGVDGSVWGFPLVVTICSTCITFAVVYIFFRNSKKRNSSLVYE